MLREYKIGETVEFDKYIFENCDIEENDSVYNRIYEMTN